MDHPYGDRRRRVRQRLRERDADAALASSGPNLQYLTGFRGECDRAHALSLGAESEATLITPEGYRTQARHDAAVDAFRTIPDNDPAQVAATVASLLPRGGTLLVDGNARYALTGALSDGLAVGSAATVFEPLRRRKDGAEIEALERSAAVADAVSEEVRALGADAVGRTEADLAREIRTRLHERGATGTSFDVVVGSGPNGADPALRHGDREIRAGEPVVLDFGCFLDGYASDQTRTVVFDDRPPGAFERVHAAVLDALESGVEAVEPGATAGDVDAAARETLAEYGYADRFVHATGHGVGLAAHESLAVAAGETTELEPGMVFSVEPGVYLDDYGVRIEDLVAVTDEGCRRLNDSPRTWRPL